MKINSLLLLLILAACASERNYNLSDLEDKNRTPAHLEREKEEERIRIYDEPLFE